MVHDAYQNKVPKEFNPSSNNETTKDERSIFTNELNALADHEMRI